MIAVATHVIVWDALKPELLSKKAKNVIKIANQTDGTVFCGISLWEIATLMNICTNMVENYLRSNLKCIQK